VALLGIALVKARTTPRRTRRQRWVLVGQLLLFLALTIGTALIRVQGETQLQAFRIASPSMLPTLLPGDLVLIDHRAVTPRRGELIEYEPKPRRGYEATGFSVKRVVAVEGDVVETRDHEVLINGAALAHVVRPCAPGTADPEGGHCTQETLAADLSYGLVWHEARHEAWGPSTLGPGEIFVLGDNRDDSLDSRHLGPVQRSEVRGRVVTIWFSWGGGKVRWSRIGRKL